MIIEPSEFVGPSPDNNAFGWYTLHDGWNMFPVPVSARELLQMAQWLGEHRKQLEDEVRQAQSKLDTDRR